MNKIEKLTKELYRKAAISLAFCHCRTIFPSEEVDIDSHINDGDIFTDDL